MSDHSTAARTEHPPIEFRDVVGFPGYCVGSDGSVWSRWVRADKAAPCLGDRWHRLRGNLLKRDGRLWVKLRDRLPAADVPGLPARRGPGPADGPARRGVPQRREGRHVTRTGTPPEPAPPVPLEQATARQLRDEMAANNVQIEDLRRALNHRLNWNARLWARLKELGATGEPGGF